MTSPKGKNREQQKEKEKTAQNAPAKEETCRCKETSEMKPGDLLRLMINDLAFWRKKGK